MDSDNNNNEISMEDAIGYIIIGGLALFFLFPLIVPFAIILFVFATGGFLFSCK